MYRDEEKKFDIRVLEKHFPSDDAIREEVRAYLRDLPDVSSKIDTAYRFNVSSLPSASRDESGETPPE